MKNEEFIKSKNSKKFYKSLLDDITDNNPTQKKLNEHVLLIDGMNLFLRNFTMNSSVNDNGEHVGGMIGFLRSLAALNKQFNPTRMVVVFDGNKSNEKRRKEQKDYKSGRQVLHKLNRAYTLETPQDIKERLKYQLQRLPAYLLYFPINVIVKETYEADDLIYLASRILTRDETCETITIVSTDKDFMQLTSNRKIQVWSPVKKKLFDYSNKDKNFNEVLPENLALFRSFLGDASDSIKGLKGIGVKTLIKIFPEFQEKVIDIDYIKNKILLKEEKKRTTKEQMILDNISTIESNLSIIDLKLVNFKYNVVNYITDVLYHKKIDLLNKTKIKEMLIYDNSNAVIRNIDRWFTEGWLPLNYHAKRYNESLE